MQRPKDNKFFKRRFQLVSMVWEMFLFVSPRIRVKIILLVGLTFLSAVLEVASIGSIIPFLAALLDPSMVVRLLNDFSPSLATYAESEGIITVLSISIFFLLVVFSSFLVKILLSFYAIEVSNRSSVELGKILFGNIFLVSGYKYISSTNPTKIMTLLTSRVGAVSSIFFSGINAIVSTVITSAIVIFLFFLNKYIVMSILAALAVSYFLYAFFSKSFLVENSKTIVQSDAAVLKVIKETASNIRHVLLEGIWEVARGVYIKKYGKLLYATGINRFLQTLPKHVIEFVAMVTLAIVGVVFVEFGVVDSARLVTVLAAVALAAQRILPHTNQIFSFWTSLAGSFDSVSWVYENFSKNLSYSDNMYAEHVVTFECIELLNLKYCHSDDENFCLSIDHLVVRRGEKILIVGESGSGKSTFVDLLVGLLTEDAGDILIDGVKRTIHNVDKFYSLFSYVPQEVYLANDSIANNIHLDRSVLYNKNAIESALERALILDFVLSLPSGICTEITDNGASLSGGQKQRIGMARAFYKKSNILVLDEATNGLDSLTERCILESILKDPDITLIMITHHSIDRDGFDKVIEISAGTIVV